MFLLNQLEASTRSIGVSLHGVNPASWLLSYMGEQFGRRRLFEASKIKFFRHRGNPSATYLKLHRETHPFPMTIAGPADTASFHS